VSPSTAERRRFLEDYRLIRHAEGRGSDDPAYYRALPFADLSGRNTAMWAMRARTWRYFERRILAPLERRAARPLDVLDLGAGNCWLSYRLAIRGNRPVALDIFSDPRDGLAAARHYDRPIPRVEADFSELPLRESAFDLAIFNASLHYSTDYDRTLAAVRRCLRPDGLLVVLETPVYRKREHGERMAAERHAQFERQYGTRSDAIRSIEFLDRSAIGALGRSQHIHWRTYKPWYGWRWHLRPLMAWLRRNRPPSRFWILTGRFDRS
jgi:ubiquinone/menaquinone biosynthesis C-methylase UbiE